MDSSYPFWLLQVRAAQANRETYVERTGAMLAMKADGPGPTASVVASYMRGAVVMAHEVAALNGTGAAGNGSAAPPGAGGGAGGMATSHHHDRQ